MEKLVIEGGVPLSGTVVPAGNKNAALPLLAACLLTEEQVILHNVPQIRDTEALMALLEDLGVKIERRDGNIVALQADAVTKKDHRYKPPRVFWAVETERLGQVPLMHLLRERLDAELSESLAVFRDREAQQRVPIREALGRLRLEDGTP